jgi:two-component system, OmpR family, phosphate regulon response regulator OmpR
MTEGEPHILVVDDDARLCALLRQFLSDQGFRVTTASDAAEARARLEGFAFDLLILDVMLPGEDGIALTRAIRDMSRVPILLLTAMAEPEDRVNGLEQGADDYLAKPFEPRELVLRIRNVLQRVIPSDTARLHFGACSFDLQRAELYHGETPVRLTEAETALLVALARHAGEAMTREDLSQEARFSGNLRTVDVQITRLRRKIERDSKFPRYLQTVRGTGYVLKPD